MKYLSCIILICLSLLGLSEYFEHIGQIGWARTCGLGWGGTIALYGFWKVAEIKAKRDV